MADPQTSHVQPATTAVAAQPTVQALLSMRLGADLCTEPWQSDALLPAWADARIHGGIDGGLLLQAEGADPACRPDLWDQLDGLLAAWLVGLETLDAGEQKPVIVTFPDTKIECELLRLNADLIAVRYEDIDTTLPLQATKRALLEAAGRLLVAVGTNLDSAALVALQHHVQQDQ